ncbi:unnamed protein product [Polarella glacialis]|uniref:Cytochrome b5 heme-binding domain-containing protein n=1 Tax=Polarella glacialis TaxID=89957 RepID=A0A813E0I7_POLGL|nr:unnamed protein product [Polarella glacialis]
MSLSAEEVAKHASKTDCWVVVGEEVLDVTEFMEDHPGGSKAIMMFAGRDATEEFDMLHERKVIKKYGIDEGTVVVKGSDLNSACFQHFFNLQVAFEWSNWHVGPKGMTHGMQSSESRFGEEVAKHASKTDCWVVVGEEVLDVTEFMEDHPGGSKAIMMFAGRDATEEFDMLHERKVASLFAIEVAAADVCVCAASWAVIKKYGIDEGTVVVKGTFKK